MQIIRNSTTGTEPVTAAEAKTWLRIDSDLTADDDLIDMLIADARIYAENYNSRFYKDANISIKVTETKYAVPGYKINKSIEDDSIDLVGKADISSVVVKRYYEEVETTLTTDVYKVSETGDYIYLKADQEWGDFDYFLITYDVINESDDQIKKCILNQVAAEYDWRKDGKIVNRTK